MRKSSNKNINISHLTGPQSELLKLVAHTLSGAEYSPSPDIDWKLVYDEALAQTVPTLINLSGITNVPADIKDKWRKRVFDTLISNSHVSFGHELIHKLLSESGIEYTILKGSSSAYYYPSDVSRVMGDVDFLIKEADIDKTKDVLLKNGFIQETGDVFPHIAFGKDGIHYEMHFGIAGIPEGNNGKLLHTWLSDIFEKSSVSSDNGFEYIKPSDFHHGLILLIHTYKHLLAEGIGLRHLCDLAVFFNSFSDSEFRGLFYEKLSSVGMWRYTQVLALICNKYLGIPYRPWFGECDESVLEKLMMDVFAGGNFGRKDSYRYHQGFAISDGMTDSVTPKRKLGNIITNLNKEVCSRFPIMRAIPILRPFGWLFYAVRYCVRVLLGKRKPIGKTLRAADKRIDLYKEFKLFE